MAPWRLKGLWLGVIYSVEGIYLVLQNPVLRQKHQLRIFLQLSILSFMLTGFAQILVGLPIHLLRLFFWTLSPTFLQDHHAVNATLTLSHAILHDLISALPFVLLLFMRYVYPQPLDNLFMESLVFVDKQYHQGHRAALPSKQLKRDHATKPSRTQHKTPLNELTFSQRLVMQKKRSRHWQNLKDSGARTWKKVRLGLLLGTLSMVPYFGAFVFPAAGAFATFKALGRTQGFLVGACFLCLPSWLTAFIIRGLLGMRVLMRELMEPYFSRMGMTHKEKRRWFDSRRDILFGFSVIAYLLIQTIPIFNFLAYGVIQASASYMVLVTDPLPVPPPPIPKKSRSSYNKSN